MAPPTLALPPPPTLPHPSRTWSSSPADSVREIWVAYGSMAPPAISATVFRVRALAPRVGIPMPDLHMPTKRQRQQTGRGGKRRWGTGEGVGARPRGCA